MILKLNNKEHTLVQVTNKNNGNVLGLYLVPKRVSIEQFEEAFELENDQDNFDLANALGVERIHAYESILDID